MFCDKNIIADALEQRGWTRAIAGETDFNATLDAIIAAKESNLGLAVSGKCGCGKTALMCAILGRPIKAFRLDLGIPGVTDCLTGEWMEYHAINPYDVDVFLDDLGAEPLINEYGIKLNLVGDFITKWHLYHSPYRHMFITTNLSADLIDERYGGRVLSRLKELCVPLRLTGNDKRQWTISSTTNK